MGECDWDLLKKPRFPRLPFFPFSASPLPLFPFFPLSSLPLFLKTVEARMRSPLRIRASTVATHFTKAPSVTKLKS